jgi:hypothetical protein
VVLVADNTVLLPDGERVVFSQRFWLGRSWRSPFVWCIEVSEDKLTSYSSLALRTSTPESREPLRLSGAILFGSEAVEKATSAQYGMAPGSSQV